jgi:hypothetical protein
MAVEIWVGILHNVAWLLGEVTTCWGTSISQHSIGAADRVPESSGGSSIASRVISEDRDDGSCGNEEPLEGDHVDRMCSKV